MHSYKGRLLLSSLEYENCCFMLNMCFLNLCNWLVKRSMNFSKELSISFFIVTRNDTASFACALFTFLSSITHCVYVTRIEASYAVSNGYLWNTLHTYTLYCLCCKWPPLPASQGLNQEVIIVASASQQQSQYSHGFCTCKYLCPERSDVQSRKEEVG